jgi:hypothetical protein
MDGRARLTGSGPFLKGKATMEQVLHSIRFFLFLVGGTASVCLLFAAVA